MSRATKTSTTLALAIALLGGCAESHETSPGPGGSSAPPSTPAPSEAAVLGALSGVEWDADAPPPALREAGAEGVLLALSLGRPGDARVVRVRATMALRHHPTEATRRHLVATVADAGDPEVASAALVTLARAFGRSHGADVRALAEERLDDPDRGVRMAAREAVARVRLARWIAE